MATSKKVSAFSLLLTVAVSSLSCSGANHFVPKDTTPRPARVLPRVAILELRLQTLPPQLAAQLRAKIFRDLVGRDYRRVVAEETSAARLRELGLLTGCSVGRCLAQLGKQLGVERVITGGIVAQGSSYDLLLTLLETSGGTLLAQVSSRCDVCTFQELKAAVGRAVSELHRAR